MLTLSDIMAAKLIYYGTVGFSRRFTSKKSQYLTHLTLFRPSIHFCIHRLLSNFHKYSAQYTTILVKMKASSPAFVAGISICLPRQARPYEITRGRVAPTAKFSLASKQYQLEELEDSSTQTSSITFLPDGAIALDTTDGPLPDSCKGSWLYDVGENTLTLEIERFFGADDTFQFSVKRVLRGFPESLTSSLPIFQGAMFREDSNFAPDEALGHFALVEAIEDKERRGRSKMGKE